MELGSLLITVANVSCGFSQPNSCSRMTVFVCWCAGCIFSTCIYLYDQYCRFSNLRSFRKIKNFLKNATMQLSCLVLCRHIGQLLLRYNHSSIQWKQKRVLQFEHAILSPLIFSRQIQQSSIYFLATIYSIKNDLCFSFNSCRKGAAELDELAKAGRGGLTFGRGFGHLGRGGSGIGGGMARGWF